MNRKVMKVVSILLMVLMVVTMLSTSVFALTQTEAINVDQFNSKGDTSGAATSMQNIIGSIITIVQVIGTGVAIIMLIVMAIKYISAAPSEKAEIKKSATIYIVGAIVLFAATGILGIVKNFAGNVKATDATKESNEETGYIEMIDVNNIYLG